MKLKIRTRAKGALVIAAALVGLAMLSSVASATTPTPFFQGFETDSSGWTSATRVASGTNGVTSKTGNYHAEDSGGNAYTQWGGYTDEFPANGYMTSIDIYLDPAAGAPNDTRFDWTSAINMPDGNHRRDFAFNAGFYNDTDATGTGPRYVISASNNTGRANSFPKNPGRDPFTITAAGWYTFQHSFRDNGSGVLAVDLSILDAGGNVLHTWTLSDPSDVIGTTVGGNRYGWFAGSNEFPFLAFDNSRLDVAVGPPTSTSQCKKGGWQQYNSPSFKNQGDCVSYVATGGRNPGAG